MAAVARLEDGYEDDDYSATVAPLSTRPEEDRRAALGRMDAHAGGAVVTAPVCPECGGVLEIDANCRIEYSMMTPFSQRRDRPLPRKTFGGKSALLCAACDYATEIVTDRYGRTR